MDPRSPTSHHIVITGRRLHYLEWNPHGARTVLFLHGGGLTARTWTSLCDGMEPRFRCLALDMRGHGDSEWSYEHAYDVAHHVSDLGAFIHALELDALHLVGMSLGGIAAMTFAAARCDSLDTLVLVDVIPGVHSHAPFEITAFFEALEAQICSTRDLDAVVDWYCQRARGKPRRVVERMVAANVRRRHDGSLAPRYHADGIHNVPSHLESLRALRAHTPRVACRTLVVKGALSRCFSVADLEDFTRRLPNGHRVVIEGAGHAVQEDQPEALRRAITAFFDGDGPPLRLTPDPPAASASCP